MALHSSLPIYKVAYDLLGVATDVVRNMPRDFKASIGGRIRDECVDADEIFESANSYFGLMRQASASHHDRARLANLVRRRGHAVNRALTQTYRTKCS